MASVGGAASSSSSADNSSAYEDAGQGKTTSSNAGDSCTWYAGSDCTRPRTCSDCLNVLLSTDSCAIDPSGACVSMSAYESYLANRYYYTPMQRYFPSAEYTYCSANDSVCASCIASWQATFESTGSSGDISYCTGSNGCVCVADCEVQDWQDTVINDQCSASNSGSAADSGTSMATRVTVSIFVGVAVALLLFFATWGVRRFVQRGRYEPTRRNMREPSRPRPPPKGPQLSLSGWNSLRQKLIETENGFVSGDAIAFQRDADTSTAPTTAVIHVQEGEGFRPASPSEHGRVASQRDRTDL